MLAGSLEHVSCWFSFFKSGPFLLAWVQEEDGNKEAELGIGLEGQIEGAQGQEEEEEDEGMEDEDEDEDEVHPWQPPGTTLADRWHTWP